MSKRINLLFLRDTLLAGIRDLPYNRYSADYALERDYLLAEVTKIEQQIKELDEN